MIALFLTLVLTSQDVPKDIAKNELPKLAHCVVCEANGGGHGEEKPAAGVMYKGKAYYFCNGKEVAEFKKDAESFMPPVLPRPLPELSISDEAGAKWNAEAFKNKVVLIDLWATWCGPCKEQMPMLDKLFETYKDRGFTILSISIDEKKALFSSFITKHKFPNPVAWDDSQAWQKLKVRVIPAMYLVKDGQIVNQWNGKQKSDVLSKAIEHSLAPKGL